MTFRRAMSKNGSLTVVGTGIMVAGHMTIEAQAAVRSADKLFYMVTDPATEQWLRRLNPSATTLADLYAEGKDRSKTYAEMSGRLIAAVRSELRVCAAFYGHPGMLATAPHTAIARLRREGYQARMLPGVSAQDCLFADLGFDPGENGWQSFEATDFLGSRRKFDPRSALILWQVSAMGESSVRRGGFKPRPERLQRLTNALRRHYPDNHRIVAYEASSFPGCKAFIQRFRLERLPRMTLRQMATIYVPPLPQRAIDPVVAKWFEQG